MPAAGRRTSSPAQVGREQRAELVDPVSNGLAADLDATLGERFLDVADAQGEPEIQPDRMRIASDGNRRRLNEISCMVPPRLAAP